MPPRSAECSRVGFAADSPLREMDSNFWFLVAKGQTVIRDGTAVSKTGADLLGNRRFESISSSGESAANPTREHSADRGGIGGLRGGLAREAARCEDQIRSTASGLFC
jgi:hypothetical protein